MICGNCGFQNAAGDEFCGSCGQFLAWTGAADEATAAGAGASGALAPPPSGPFAPQPVASPPGQTGPPGQPGQAAPPPPIGAPPPPPPANPAIQWPAGLQRCDVCGTANELSRTFCLNCGAKLKRAGTTTGAALAVAAAQEERRRGMRMVGWAILGTIIFVAAIAIAFVAFGGLAPVAPAATATPLSSLVALNPSGSLPPLGSPSASSVAPTGQPVATLPASIEPPATAPASSPPVTLPPETAPPPTLGPPSVPPATAPPAGGFVCSASTYSAAQPGGWKIVRAHWSRKLAGDTLALEMEPSSSGSTASVDANVMAPDQVQPTYGVPGPASGSLAIVLVFNDAVSLSGPFGSPVGYRALQEFQIYRSAGRVVVVMGVNGSGCYGLSSEAWSTGSSAAPELDVAIQH